MKKQLLGDFVNIKTGKLDANACDEDGLYPFFTCAVEPLKINNYEYDCECVLIAGNGDLNVKYYNGKFNAYQRTYIIESKDKNILDLKYLFHFLTKYIEKLRNDSIGGVIKYIKLANLTDIKIPIPTLETQKQIAEVLDKADELRQKKKLANEKLDEFLQSTFLDMFGDPVKNPKGWFSTNIGEMCHFIKDGPHLSPNYTESGIPFISVNNIIKGKWNLENVKYVSKEDHEVFKKRCNPEKGDILYTKGGTTGFAKYIDIDLEFSNWVHLAVLKYNKDNLNGRFFEAMLNSPYCYTQSQRYTRGIANRDLVLGEMKKIKFYLPPIELQDKFAQIVEIVEEQKAKNEIAIQKLDDLFNSLLQKVFKGELEFSKGLIV